MQNAELFLGGEIRFYINTDSRFFDISKLHSYYPVTKKSAPEKFECAIYNRY